MKQQMQRLFLSAVLIVLCVPRVFARKQATGTIIVFGVSNQFITVAADSKMVEVNTRKAVTTCKITPLSDKYIFAVTGMEFLQSTSHPNLCWDADQQARTAFRLISSSTGVHINPSFLTSVATQWAMAAKKEFSQMTVVDRRWFWHQVKDTHIRAFFGGFDEDGAIAIVEARLNLIREGQDFSYKVYSYQEGETPRFFAIGETRIASEFILLKTARARREYYKFRALVKNKPPIQQASLRTIDLVRLTLEYLPHTYLGPPIRAVILERKGVVQWVPGRACN